TTTAGGGCQTPPRRSPASLRMPAADRVDQQMRVVDTLRSGGVANHRRAPSRAATPALRHIATPLRRNRARDHVATLVSGPGGIDHATTHPSDHAHATTPPSGRSVTSRQTPPPSRPPAPGPGRTPPTGPSRTSPH